MNPHPLPDNLRFTLLLPTHFLSLILATTVFPTTGEAQPARITHLGSTPGEVSFLVGFDRPTTVSRDIDGRTYRFPNWTTLSTPAGPGEPALPAKVVRVALPPVAGDPSQGIRVTTRVVERERQTGVRFPPSPRWVRTPGTDGTVRLIAREGPSYQAGARSQVEVLSVGMERGGAPRIRFLCRPELVVIDIVPE